MKECIECGESKPLTEFFGSSKYKGKQYYQTRCKPCSLKIKKDRYNNGTTKAYHLWHTQQARAKRLGIPYDVTVEDIEVLLKQEKCYYCNYPNDGTLTMHIEHRQPVSKGGQHSVDNLVLTCQCCNMGKQDLTEQEFKNWLAGVVSRLGQSDLIP